MFRGNKYSRVQFDIENKTTRFLVSFSKLKQLRQMSAEKGEHHAITFKKSVKRALLWTILFIPNGLMNKNSYLMAMICSIY